VSPEFWAKRETSPPQRGCRPPMNDLGGHLTEPPVVQGTNVRITRRSFRSLLIEALSLSAPPRPGPQPCAVPFRCMRGSPQFRSVRRAAGYIPRPRRRGRKHKLTGAYERRAFLATQCNQSMTFDYAALLSSSQGRSYFWTVAFREHPA